MQCHEDVVSGEDVNKTSSEGHRFFKAFLWPVSCIYMQCRVMDLGFPLKIDKLFVVSRCSVRYISSGNRSFFIRIPVALHSVSRWIAFSV